GAVYRTRDRQRSRWSPWVGPLVRAPRRRSPAAPRSRNLSYCKIKAESDPMQAETPAPAAPPPPADREGPSLLVSLATYNERENLAQLVPAVLAEVPHAHVLVIDDASPDGTGKLADEMAAADPRVRVLHRPGKLGLGTALLAAMRYAADHGYDYLLNMDADFSH